MDAPSRTVLVVDDDRSIRFLCRVNLELDGWTIREAETFDEARAHLADGTVAVVLLDVHVGADSGVAFLEELRRDHPGTPVALLTGSVGGPAVVGPEPERVISKPFTLDELTGTVRALAG